MHVHKTKFESNDSPEYYHMICNGKTNIQAKEVYCLSSLISIVWSWIVGMKLFQEIGSGSRGGKEPL